MSALNNKKSGTRQGSQSQQNVGSKKEPTYPIQFRALTFFRDLAKRIVPKGKTLASVDSEAHRIGMFALALLSQPDEHGEYAGIPFSDIAQAIEPIFEKYYSEADRLGKLPPMYYRVISPNGMMPMAMGVPMTMNGQEAPKTVEPTESSVPTLSSTANNAFENPMVL